MQLFTHDGIQAVYLLKKEGLNEQKAREIINTLDKNLSIALETIRQYKACYGITHNWLNVRKERFRIARELLDDCEEDYNQNND